MKDSDNDSIYFINENHCYGGGEKMFMWLSKKLYDDGYNVKYCMLYKNDEIDTTPVPTDYLNFKFYNSYLLRNLSYFTIGAYKIAKYIKKNNVKKVVCFGFNSFYILGLLKHVLKFQLITSERGDPKRKRWSKLRKFLFSLSDGAVFQTSGAKLYYDTCKESRTAVIPNPVIIPNEQWNDIAGKNNVIYVGRIDFNQKRIDILISAFCKVVEIIPDAKLTIVGDGYEMSKLQDLIIKYKLSNNIELAGFQKNTLAFMKNANVFAMSSDFEGIPNSLLEAMAFGMPVVSTDCTPGGAYFLIGNNENGLIVPKGDALALANGIIKLLQNKCLRKTFANKAKSAMLQFDENAIINKWKDFIDKIFYD